MSIPIPTCDRKGCKRSGMVIFPDGKVYCSSDALGRYERDKFQREAIGVRNLAAEVRP